MKLILVRHGETIENKAGVIQGQNHGRLTPLGLEQAKLVGLRFKGEKIHKIYSSNLARCVQTTREIKRHHPGIPTTYVPELRERDIGSLTGRKKADVNSSTPAFGAESWGEVRSRVKRFLGEIYEQHENHTVLFSTHKGPIRELIKEITRLPADDAVKKFQGNTAITIIDVSKGKDGKLKYELLAMNDASHLN